MILRVLRQAAIAAAMIVTFPSALPASANESYDEFMGRLTNKRYDLERYGRAYTKTMRQLEQFQSWRCAPTAQSQKEWTDYAEKLAKLLFDYSNYSQYDDQGEPRPLRKRQEARDMADRLIGAYTAVRKLPQCPQGGSTTPPPPPKETPPEKPTSEESEPETPPGDSGAPTDLGQLTPDEMKLLKCASEQEKAQIKDYQHEIKKLRQRLKEIEKPIHDADAEVERLTDEALKYADTVKPNEPKSQTYYSQLEKLQEQASQARQKAGRIRRELQPQIGDLNTRMNDIDREMRDLLREMEGRTSCVPPGNAGDDEDDDDDDDGDDNENANGKGVLGDVLDNVNIGIGVSSGRGGGRRGGGCGPRPRPTN